MLKMADIRLLDGWKARMRYPQQLQVQQTLIAALASDSFPVDGGLVDSFPVDGCLLLVAFESNKLDDHLMQLRAVLLQALGGNVRFFHALDVFHLQLLVEQYSPAIVHVFGSRLCKPFIGLVLVLGSLLDFYRPFGGQEGFENDPEP